MFRPLLMPLFKRSKYSIIFLVEIFTVLEKGHQERPKRCNFIRKSYSVKLKTYLIMTTICFLLLRVPTISYSAIFNNVTLARTAVPMVKQLAFTQPVTLMDVSQ